jgi:hypothetical protein
MLKEIAIDLVLLPAWSAHRDNRARLLTTAG